MLNLINDKAQITRTKYSYMQCGATPVLLIGYNEMRLLYRRLSS